MGMFFECSRCGEQHGYSENADKCCAALKERDRIVGVLRHWEDAYGEKHNSDFFAEGRHWDDWNW